MTDDLLGEVRDWLDRNGYVLEMEVARAAVESGAFAFQGDTIEDPETGKLREQDVLAFWVSGFLEGRSHAVAAPIECKSTTAPWVCFSGHQQGNGSWSPLYLMDPDHCLACGRLEDYRTEFERELPHAYAIRQKRNADKSGPDHAYEATRQAAAAAVARYAEVADTLGHPDETVISSLAVPCVVTRSPLVVCSLDQAGEVCIERSELVMVNVPMKGTPRDWEGVAVLVINQSAVASVMARFAKWAHECSEPEEAGDGS